MERLKGGPIFVRCGRGFDRTTAGRHAEGDWHSPPTQDGPQLAQVAHCCPHPSPARGRTHDAQGRTAGKDPVERPGGHLTTHRPGTLCVFRQTVSFGRRQLEEGLMPSPGHFPRDPGWRSTSSVQHPSSFSWNQDSRAPTSVSSATPKISVMTFPNMWKCSGGARSRQATSTSRSVTRWPSAAPLIGGRGPSRSNAMGTCSGSSIRGTSSSASSNGLRRRTSTRSAR